MSNGATESAVIVAEPQAIELGTLRADSPKGLIAGATEIANALRDVIVSRKLSTNIQGREYVRVEGWLVLATLLGAMPREVNVEKDGGTYTATVELVRPGDGIVLTRASAECGDDEPTWGKRPAYARRSMAITRATGKSCRIAFSWVMALTGYETTPAEEMDGIEPSRPARQTKASPGRPSFGARSAPEPEDVEPIAPQAGEPDWYGETIRGGKHAGRTWREMAAGNPGGERHQYVEWMATKAQKLEPETIERARYVHRLYTEREMGA